MAALGADRFVVDRVRGRMDLPATLRAIRDLTRRYPRAELKLVEDKANGPAVIQSLKHEIRGLVAVNPEGGKMARVMGASPLVEAGNCYLPHPQLYSWVEEFIAECAAFPAGAYDDQVDAFSQGANRLLPHRPKQVRRPSYFPEQYRGERAWMI